MHSITRRAFLAAAGASALALPLCHAQETATQNTPNIKPGVWPVMYTPFTDAREVDYDAVEELVEFYIATKTAGVFAAALTGEFFDLSAKEALEMGRHAVQHAAGRMGVVVAANYGATLQEQAHNLARMQDAGVDAAVVVLSNLPSGDQIEEQLIRLTELTDGPLGVYECPRPQHRQISADTVKRIAQTGRYHFMKETSWEADACGAKIQAAKDTPFRIFSATLSITPKVMELGADGHCGTVANCCPELMARLCASHDAVEQENLLHSLTAVNDIVMGSVYPDSGKYLLQKRGLHLKTVSRKVADGKFTEDARKNLDDFLAHFDFHTGLLPGQTKRNPH
jgi:4-hydroxy-tetrahydrodipicolinate synthase